MSFLSRERFQGRTAIRLSCLSWGEEEGSGYWLGGILLLSFSPMQHFFRWEFTRMALYSRKRRGEETIVVLARSYDRQHRAGAFRCLGCSKVPPE